MAFKLGPKALIVNSAEQAQLLFYAQLASGVKRLVETDDDFETSTPFDNLATSPDTQSGAEGAGYLPATPADDETIAQADFLRIVGFADLVGSDVVEVIGFKGVPAVKQVATLTIVEPGAVAGEEVALEFEFESDDLRGEFASHASDYKKKRYVVITTTAADTATTVAAKIIADLQSQIDDGWAPWIKASADAGVITLTSVDAKVKFKVSAKGSAIDAGHITAAFAVTTAGFSGRNTYEQLKSLRLETINYPYAEEAKVAQIPVKGAKYSQYIIRKKVSRPDLAGWAGLNDVPEGTFDLVIYVNEALTVYIANLTKWLNANVAKRTMYTSTTASGVLGGDAATSATSVDSTEQFTTPLV